MGNKWKEIWNGKVADVDIQKLCDIKDEFTMYSALKKLDGFDVNVEEAENYYSSFYHSAIHIWETLIRDKKISSAYEVGCGSGADLFLLKNRGIKTGGIDYSANLSGIAGSVLGKTCAVETGEAMAMSSGDTYDLVFSDSVFAYFPDEKYGESILEKMYEKANKMVVILEVFDKDWQDECERHRRAMLPDYDERYAGLEKVFYSRAMFRNFAEKRHCAIRFDSVENPYYWNSKYLFNCYIYKA